jgi:hypothetical protein
MSAYYHDTNDMRLSVPFSYNCLYITMTIEQWSNKWGTCKYRVDLNVVDESELVWLQL